jgi:hypothetical protein
VDVVASEFVECHGDGSKNVVLFHNFN